MSSNRGVYLLMLVLSLALLSPTPARSEGEPRPPNVDATLAASEAALPGSRELVPSGPVRADGVPTMAQIEELHRRVEGRHVRVTTFGGTFEMRRVHVNTRGLRPGHEVDYGPVTLGGRPSRSGDVIEENDVDSTEMFTWAAIRRIDEGRVRRRKGAMIGGAVGALTAFVLYPVIDWYTQTIPLGLVIGSIVPVALGAGVGAAIPSGETWTPVYLRNVPSD